MSQRSGAKSAFHTNYSSSRVFLPAGHCCSRSWRRSLSSSSGRCESSVPSRSGNSPSESPASETETSAWKEKKHRIKQFFSFQFKASLNVFLANQQQRNSSTSWKTNNLDRTPAYIVVRVNKQQTESNIIIQHLVEQWLCYKTKTMS